MKLKEYHFSIRVPQKENGWLATIEIPLWARLLAVYPNSDVGLTISYADTEHAQPNKKLEIYLLTAEQTLVGSAFFVGVIDGFHVFAREL